jgi:hypothetical protein
MIFVTRVKYPRSGFVLGHRLLPYRFAPLRLCASPWAKKPITTGRPIYRYLLRAHGEECTPSDHVNTGQHAQVMGGLENTHLLLKVVKLHPSTPRQ